MRKYAILDYATRELNNQLKDKEIIFVARRRYSEYGKDDTEPERIIKANTFHVYTGVFYFERSLNTYLLKLIDKETKEFKGICVERHIPGVSESDICVFDTYEEAEEYCIKCNAIMLKEVIHNLKNEMQEEIDKINNKYMDKINILLSEYDKNKNILALKYSFTDMDNFTDCHVSPLNK